MDKDLSTVYALVSSYISLLFGIEIGVAFCALAGAFLSVRFAEPKTNWEQIKQVFWSALSACIVTGCTNAMFTNPPPLKLVGFLSGIVILLVFEKAYKTLRDTDLRETLVDWLNRFTPKS